MNTAHPPRPNSPLTRRRFLKGVVAAAAVVPHIITSAVWAAKPNSRITLGFIGVGMMGRAHLKAFLGYPEVQVVAISEIAAIRRDAALATVSIAYAGRKESGDYRDCAALDDFRQLIVRKDIDAVVIATPDHWHALPAIQAARARKDIYCEKPLSLTIKEARAMVDATRKARIVFQTGSQQRCEFGGKFRLACELIRSGRIGTVKTVRVGVGAPNKPCDLPTEALPTGIDWDRWLGPAPFRGYNQILCPRDIHNHYPKWRDYREYAGGGLADMGAHHFDIAQWALDMDHSGPVEVHPPEGDAQTGLRFVYANGVEMFHGGPSGCTFEGTAGTLYVDRKTIESTPESIVKEPLGAGDVHLENPGDNHKKDWLECIRTRRTPLADVEIGARSATVCHLGNLGYLLRRSLWWDPKREKFIGDHEANRLLDRPCRKPWKLG